MMVDIICNIIVLAAGIFIGSAAIDWWRKNK